MILKIEIVIYGVSLIENVSGLGVESVGMLNV